MILPLGNRAQHWDNSGEEGMLCKFEPRDEVMDAICEPEALWLTGSLGPGG